MLIKKSSKCLKAFLGAALAIAIVVSPLQAINMQANAEASGDELVYFEDNFDREDGTLINGDNGWICLPRSATDKSHVIENGALKTEDFKYSDTYTGNGACTAVTKRPASEAAVNQFVSTEIKNLKNIGNGATANIHLRVLPQSGTNSSGVLNPAECYYLAVSYDTIQIRIVKPTSVGTSGLSDKISYTINREHSYGVEFTARGTYPTLLEGRLYDLTDNTLAATVTYSDSTANLQTAGTVALSCNRNGEDESIGRYYALYDNFVYKAVADTEIFSDTFNRTGELGNGWVAGPMASGTLTGEAFNIKTAFPDGNTDNLAHVEQASYVRPMSEKSLNQTVEVEFSRGNSSGYYIGGTVIARAQSETFNQAQCYSATVALGWGGATFWDGRLIVKAGTEEFNVHEKKGGLGPNYRYRLRMNVTSISDTETAIVVTLFLSSNNGETWSKKFTYTTTDDNPTLQNPGTAGFSLWDEKHYDINVYNFKYSSIPDFYVVEPVFNKTELESGMTYKNMYKAETTDEVSAAVQTGTYKPATNGNIAKFLNQNSAYVACAFNAAESGEYIFKTDFKVTGGNGETAEDYYTANGEYPYAYIVAGSKAYKLEYSDNSGGFASSGEVKVALNAGTNIVYFMGATAELTDKLPGAAIAYDCVYTEEAVKAVGADFAVPGDLNTDGTADIRDLIRLKRYIAGEQADVAYDSINALTQTDSAEYAAADLTVLRRYLLAAGSNSEEFNSLTWLVFKKAAEFDNTYYKLTQENKLNVAYFGGSITSGYGSTDSSLYSWRALTTAWLKEQYPDAEITETNAAIGGTGTSYGMYRAVSDLKLDSAAEKPDLVFIEFAINDLYDGVGYDGAKSNMETIIRTIYEYAPDADIMLLLTTDKSRANTEYETVKAHKEIAAAYRLPYLVIGSMLWDDLCTESGSTYPSDTVWSKYFYDYVHPADAGYAKYAGYVTAYLSEVFSQKTETVKGSVNKYAPAEPITEITYSPYAANAKGQTATTGFGVQTDGYVVSNNPGNSISFKFTGTDLKLWVWATENSGSIDMEIDGVSVGSADLYRKTQNHKIIPVASGLENTEHTFKLTLQSTDNGGQMYLRWFLISGSDDHSGITIVQ